MWWANKVQQEARQTHTQSYTKNHYLIESMIQKSKHTPLNSSSSRYQIPHSIHSIIFIQCNEVAVTITYYYGIRKNPEDKLSWWCRKIVEGNHTYTLAAKYSVVRAIYAWKWMTVKWELNKILSNAHNNKMTINFSYVCTTSNRRDTYVNNNKKKLPTESLLFFLCCSSFGVPQSMENWYSSWTKTAVYLFQAWHT